MNVDEVQSVILFRRDGDRVSFHAREHTRTHTRTQRQARAHTGTLLSRQRRRRAVACSQTPQVVTHTLIKLFFGVGTLALLSLPPSWGLRRTGKRSRRE